MIYGYRIISRVTKSGRKNGWFKFVIKCLEWANTEYYYYDDWGYTVFKIALSKYKRAQRNFHPHRIEVFYPKGMSIDFKLDFIEENKEIKMRNSITENRIKEILKYDDWKIGYHPLVEEDI